MSGPVRDLRLLIFGIVALLVGCVQLFFAWRYAEAAKSERTAVGHITYISGGRSSTYDYAFEIDGVRLIQDSGVCRTALSSKGCVVGAPVLVYYAHTPVLITRLEEFGGASRGKLILGSLAAAFGFALLLIHFVRMFQDRASESPDDSASQDESGSSSRDVIHVTSDE